jgi:hypothetical protein
MATFTMEDMERFATEAWGPLGTSTVKKWAEFNERFFDGALRPVPLVISRTMAFGKCIGKCSYNPDNYGRAITLNVPAVRTFLLADNCTLLHEMIHQFLFECGEDAAHAGDGWRREIMRLNKLITGEDIWAGRSTTARREVAGVKTVVRINIPKPDTGEKSLGQMAIARWPHDQGDIHLGALGS